MSGGCDPRATGLKELEEEVARVTSKLRGVKAYLRKWEKKNLKKGTRQRQSGLWATMTSVIVLTGGDVQLLSQYLRVQRLCPSERIELLPELTAWQSRVTDTRDEFVARASKDLKLRPSLDRAEKILQESKMNT